MTRLITTDELKQDGFINSNLDNEYLYSAIDEAQDIFLREIIGDSLYVTLQNKVLEEDIEGVYQTLLESYIKIFLKYKVLALLCVPLNFKLRNIGIAQQFGNEVNTTSLDDTKYLQNYYEGKADFYANRLTKFLQTNHIPEYKCSCNQITEPNENHPVSGIYLGTSKSRLVGCSSSTGSSGGSGSSEAVWGKIKGNISDQLDLQNELTIKVNRSELARVATSGSFNDLTNKPDIPTKTSELDNDSGFLTEHQQLKTINNESLIGTGNIEIEGGSGRNTWFGSQAQFDAIPESELDQETDYYISGLIAWDDISHPYIPTKTSDLNNDANFTSAREVSSEITRSIKVFEKRVQYVSQAEFDSLEQAGTLKDGVTYFIEGEYVIPTKTSELTNDSGFLTEHQSIKTINGESLIGTGNLEISGFSGDYNDLTNTPHIPSTTIEMEVEFEDGTSTTYNVYIQ